MSTGHVSENSTRLLLKSAVISTAVSASSLFAFWFGRIYKPTPLHAVLGFFAFFAVPGYAARTLCPFGGFLYYALPLLFNLLFYVCVAFGILVMRGKPQRRVFWATLVGLLSLPVLIVFVGLHNDVPAWPVLFVAGVLAFAANFRNSKGWIYILPLAYVAALLYISAHRVYLA